MYSRDTGRGNSSEGGGGGACAKQRLLRALALQARAAPAPAAPAPAAARTPLGQHRRKPLHHEADLRRRQRRVGRGHRRRSGALGFARQLNSQAPPPRRARGRAVPRRLAPHRPPDVPRATTRTRARRLPRARRKEGPQARHRPRRKLRREVRGPPQALRGWLAPAELRLRGGRNAPPRAVVPLLGREGVSVR